jgi:hypothetical protein
MFTTSAQKQSEVLYSSSIVLVDSMRVLFFLSVTPFSSGVQGGLMLDTFLVKIFFHLSVLELSSVITPYLLDLSIKLNFNSLQEFL